MSEYKCSRGAFLKTMGGVMSAAVLSSLSGIASAQTQAPVVGCKKVTSDFKGEKAKVFFTRHIDAEHLKKLYALINDEVKGKVAIKLHTGEQHGPNILPRDMVKEFQQTISTNVNVFHDEIPLGIYGPTIKKCKVDAKYRNSLALAPTILDLLGFGQYQNHFLGNSLFEEPSKWERYCAQGNSLFHIDDDGVVRKSNNKEVKKMMKLFYSIGG